MFYIEISTEKKLMGFNYDMYDWSWRNGIYMFLKNNPSPGGGGGGVFINVIIHMLNLRNTKLRTIGNIDPYVLPQEK